MDDLCYGCRLDNRYYDDLNGLYPFCSIKAQKKIDKCPCILCLVKSMCNQGCPERFELVRLHVSWRTSEY
jgi:hypothetical protein